MKITIRPATKLRRSSYTVKWQLTVGSAPSRRFSIIAWKRSANIMKNESPVIPAGSS